MTVQNNSRTNHGPPTSSGPPERNLRALWAVLAITLTFFLIEVVGAVLTNSLALLADAGHMLTDVAALGLAVFATWFARRPATATRSYGHHRTEILAALVNGIGLGALVAYIFWEAIQRLQSPPEVRSGPMLVVAAAGLLANILGGAVLLRSSKQSLNLRAAFLNVVGDGISSVGIIIAGVLMLTLGWYLADPIISMIVGVIILVNAVALVRDATRVLMEGTPSEMTLHQLHDALKTSPGIAGVHDLHAWSLTSGYNAMSAHVVVSDGLTPAQRDDVLDRLHHLIEETFPIQHTTIQMETTSRCCTDESHLPGHRQEPSARP